MGKPYAGKPHVRFDEGAERKRPEIEDLYPLPLFLSLYSTGIYNNRVLAEQQRFFDKTY